MSVSLSKPALITIPSRIVRKNRRDVEALQNLIGTREYDRLRRNDLNAVQSVIYWGQR